MTEKQESILNTALDLFANRGYHSTPTSLVAQKAGVSEGLIFRHFGSKEGLLKAVLDKGEKPIDELYENLVNEESPKKVIKKTIKMPFNASKEIFESWKLIYKLRWEVPYNSTKKTKSLFHTLHKAFKKLGYEDPENEAELLLLYLDGMGTALLMNQMDEKHQMKKFLYKKYKV